MVFYKKVFGRLFSKPFTRKFPWGKAEVSENYRGKPKFDKKKCIGCGLCERICPAKCIKVDKKKKQIEIDLTKCIFCGYCEEICPVDAIKFTNKFDNASSKKKGLVVK